jgi:DNA-binding LacI/PurR family transcriptional regulator
MVNDREDKTDIPSSAQFMVRQVLETYPKVTAVFCRQDYHAIGAYRALIHAGKKIPDDVAVMGNFDLQRMLFLDPPLTSVTTPIVEGMEKAMEFILKPEDERRDKVIDLSDRIKLCVRGSTVSDM